MILDSDWEAEFCRVAESHPKVRAYVKNHNLGLEVPYRYGSETRKYLPDFIVLVDDGHGDDDLLHLIVEIKGYRREDAKEKKSTMETYWVPGVNNLGTYGRWAFAEFTEVYQIEADFKAKVESEFNKMIDVRHRAAGGRKEASMAKKVQRNSKDRRNTQARRGDKRKNIPTAEYPVRDAAGAAERRSASPTSAATATSTRNSSGAARMSRTGRDLVVHAPPLYIQEKVHPKVLIDDLLRQHAEAEQRGWQSDQLDLFADFNGMPEGADKTEFYQHDQNWSNRMILGDCFRSWPVLAEREGLRGKVQCIYIDPPYGIKFNSNFQWSTTSRDVKDGKVDHITREPEQVKAFRDTWRDGIHSYLTYLRDRLTVARDLLTDSGSIFVQIGDENVHRVRAVMDEVFGDDNFVALITFKKTGSADSAIRSPTSQLTTSSGIAKDREPSSIDSSYSLARTNVDANYQLAADSRRGRLPTAYATKRSGRSIAAIAMPGCLQTTSLTEPGQAASSFTIRVSRAEYSTPGKRWLEDYRSLG